MLSHSFDSFYVVTKFILRNIEDLKFLPIEFDSSGNYLNVDLSRDEFPTQYIPNLKTFVRKIYHSLISTRNKLTFITEKLLIF